MRFECIYTKCFLCETFVQKQHNGFKNNFLCQKCREIALKHETIRKYVINGGLKNDR
jgi:endogenous inhibitor of DNA gyrase (YacG/DUF329 family)